MKHTVSDCSTQRRATDSFEKIQNKANAVKTNCFHDLLVQYLSHRAPHETLHVTSIID